jgi:hypothetical protein
MISFFLEQGATIASRSLESGDGSSPGWRQAWVRRDRWSRKQQATSTPTLPFAAFPRPLPGRKRHA